MSERTFLTADKAQVGMKVRQYDHVLRPSYRDGAIVGLGEHVPGTPHRWLAVEFKGRLSGQPVVLTCSTAQLVALPESQSPCS